MSDIITQTNKFNPKDIGAWKLRVKLMREEHKETTQEMEKQFYEMAAQRDKLTALVETADRLAETVVDFELNISAITKLVDAYQSLRKEQGK